MATYNQPSFQDYRNQISVIELALHAGYEWQPKKGKTMPVLYHAGYDDHIVVKNPNDSSNQVYFQTGSYTDRGTLINFVSNRLTACFSRFNNPLRSPAQCVNDVLKDYLGIVPEQKKSVKKLEDFIHQSFRTASTEKEFAVEHFKLCQLSPKNYLTQERYIHPDLLNSFQFSGTVATQRIYFSEGRPVALSSTEQPPSGERVIENIAFPYIPGDGEPINGIEQRSANGFKNHAQGRVGDMASGFPIQTKTLPGELSSVKVPLTCCRFDNWKSARDSMPAQIAGMHLSEGVYPWTT